MPGDLFDVIIYHSIAKDAPCTDGWASAYAAWKHNPDIQAVPFVYGDVPPDVTGKRVLMADVSAPLEDMRRMSESATRFVHIDHHRTAIEALQGALPRAEQVYDVRSSGAVLTWRFLHGDISVPKALLYVADADLWKFELPSSREIRAFMTAVRFTFAEWDQLIVKLEDPELFSISSAMGKTVLMAQEQVVERMLVHHYVIETAVGPIALLNTPAYQSECGAKLAEKYGIACVWVANKDEVKLSFRSAHGKDCTPLAKAFGGGGHPSAAGATITRLSKFTTMGPIEVEEAIAAAARRVHDGA